MVPQLTDVTARAQADTDACISFLINGGAFRGRLVRLNATVSEILARHQDPPEVGALLSEAMAAAVALAGGLKYEGVFTLQIQGDGPVSMLVVDITSGGDVRAWARFDAERLAAELGRKRPGGLGPHLLGAGHLAFTVDQGPDPERYQGIVELGGGSLAESIHNYFRHSEQLDSALKVAVAPGRAAAMLIQRMPEEGGIPGELPEDPEDAWRAAVILLGSLKDSELLDANLSSWDLLNRIYGTVGMKAFRIKHIQAKCRCSRPRSAKILASFPLEEVRNLSDHGAVRMTCEFCREVYSFSLEELAQLAQQSPPAQPDEEHP